MYTISFVGVEETSKAQRSRKVLSAVSCCIFLVYFVCYNLYIYSTLLLSTYFLFIQQGAYKGVLL